MVINLLLLNASRDKRSLPPQRPCSIFRNAIRNIRLALYWSLNLFVSVHWSWALIKTKCKYICHCLLTRLPAPLDCENQEVKACNFYCCAQILGQNLARHGPWQVHGFYILGLQRESARRLKTYLDISTESCPHHSHPFTHIVNSSVTFTALFYT